MAGKQESPVSFQGTYATTSFEGNVWRMDACTNATFVPIKPVDAIWHSSLHSSPRSLLLSALPCFFFFVCVSRNYQISTTCLKKLLLL
jgi:hypothetical protein